MNSIVSHDRLVITFCIRVGETIIQVLTTQADQTGTPDSAPLGRRARKAQAARRALLDAGVRLFAQRPIASVSVQDITDAADVAKGVFYLHFENRDAFLLSLYRDQQEVLLALLEATPAPKNGDQPHTERAARGYARFARDHRSSAIYWWRFAGLLPDEVGAPDHLREAREAYLARLAAWLLPTVRRSAASIQHAARIDAIAWGLIGQALQRGKATPTERTLRAVLSAATARGRENPRPAR